MGAPVYRSPEEHGTAPVEQPATSQGQGCSQEQPTTQDSFRRILRVGCSQDSESSQPSRFLIATTSPPPTTLQPLIVSTTSTSPPLLQDSSSHLFPQPHTTSQPPGSPSTRPSPSTSLPHTSPSLLSIASIASSPTSDATQLFPSTTQPETFPVSPTSFTTGTGMTSPSGAEISNSPTCSNTTPTPSPSSSPPPQEEEMCSSSPPLLTDFGREATSETNGCWSGGYFDWVMNCLDREASQGNTQEGTRRPVSWFHNWMVPPWFAVFCWLVGTGFTLVGMYVLFTVDTQSRKAKSKGQHFHGNNGNPKVMGLTMVDSITMIIFGISLNSIVMIVVVLTTYLERSRPRHTGTSNDLPPSYDTISKTETPPPEYEHLFPSSSSSTSFLPSAVRDSITPPSSSSSGTPLLVSSSFNKNFYSIDLSSPALSPNTSSSPPSTPPPPSPPPTPNLPPPYTPSSTRPPLLSSSSSSSYLSCLSKFSSQVRDSPSPPPLSSPTLLRHARSPTPPRPPFLSTSTSSSSFVSCTSVVI